MKSTHDLAAYFREGCENGDVEDMIQEGMSFAKIAEHYGIGTTTVQRLVQKYNLKRSRRFISFSERTEVVVEPDPIKYLALYSQWRTAC
jgi:DNA-directed RNA polymerase specialized sigma subunit